MIRANRDRSGRTFTGDDRPGRLNLGVPARGAAVPALRDADPGGLARRRSDPGAQHVLVSDLPDVTRCGPRINQNRRRTIDREVISVGTTVFERQRPAASIIQRSLAETRQSVFWLDDAA